jgi:glyoxalase family protein
MNEPGSGILGQTNNKIPIKGIHHISAIAGDPQVNAGFYMGVLGLRMIKRTVNFDDPSKYHLYYGNESGNPGTIMTFFPWPGARKGRIGTGQATVTSFSIPQESLSFWTDRLIEHSVTFQGPMRRFDETFISFNDPDGLQLELVADGKDDTRIPFKRSAIPDSFAIRGFFGTTLALRNIQDTSMILTDFLGYRKTNLDGNRIRFAHPDFYNGSVVDLEHHPDLAQGTVAVGTVHHIAFRVPDPTSQESIRNKIVGSGIEVTPVRDRKYFRSIYFREPGGVLFEIATDSPGFTVDESLEDLGKSLKLPEWLESKRSEIEHILPTLVIPDVEKV